MDDQSHEDADRCKDNRFLIRDLNYIGDGTDKEWQINDQRLGYGFSTQKTVCSKGYGDKTIGHEEYGDRRLFIKARSIIG